MSDMRIESAAAGISVYLTVHNPTPAALIVLNAISQKRRGVRVVRQNGFWTVWTGPDTPAGEPAELSRMLREAPAHLKFIAERFGITEPISAETISAATPTATPQPLRASTRPAHRCRRCGETAPERFGNGGSVDLCDDCQEDL